MSATLPDLFVGGAPEHGVVRYAQEVARAVVDAYLSRGALAESPPRLVESLQDPRGGSPLHIHFTDRLFGSSPEEAAAHFEGIAALAPVSVTLHDVPQLSDGAVNLPRRRDCYRRVLAASRGVVCNSFHEVSLLRELGIMTAGPPPVVIPLAAPSLVSGSIDVANLDSDAALVGFVYPGKGHREVIESVARLGGGLGVVALGSASAGHEADVTSLVTFAESLGVRFSATGYLSDHELLRRCSLAAVPIAAHQHMSASASILTWLMAGRRPLVADSRYAREMHELRPGTMTLYATNGMDAAVAAALADPASTVLDAQVDIAPRMTDAVESYTTWWSSMAW